MPPLLIVHLIHCVTGGGATRSMVATAMHSARSGFRHRIVSLLPAEQGGHRLVQEAGLALIDAPDRAALLAEIERGDIVQVHFWNNPELYALLRTPLPAKRLLIWMHVAGEHAPQVLLPALVEAATMVVASSPYTLDLPVLRALPKSVKAEKVAMIWSAPDFSRLSGLVQRPHDRFNVGYIGTVSFVKMHPHFVRMSAGIDVPDVRFIVCGGGRDLHTLQAQARTMGAGERFSWRGYVEDIRSVLAMLDVFGYPLCEDNYSTAELVVQEAMFAGVPPVLFAHGGAQRTVRHGETGLIVHSEAEYREAITYLYEHPEDRARLGATARAYALQHYGAEKAAAQFNLLYRKMASQPAFGGTARVRPPLPPGPFSGAEAFVASLGDTAPQFSESLRSAAIETLWEAEKMIAAASAVLANPVGGGFRHYLSRYPTDGYLRLWSGLAHQHQGQNARALLDFRKAIDGGCNHWRVWWYLARAAAAVQARPLARQALDVVTSAAPGFEEARRLHRRLLEEEAYLPPRKP